MRNGMVGALIKDEEEDILSVVLDRLKVCGEEEEKTAVGRSPDEDVRVKAETDSKRE